MSSNRRPQCRWARYALGSWRESMAFLGAKLHKDARREARHEDARLDRKAGDCAACGWITGRSTCQMCGAEIARET